MYSYSKKKVPSKSDSFLADARETDVVIPVIGQSGAGKSSFINTLANDDQRPVSDGIDLGTKSIGHVIVDNPKNPAQRIILVDTPGFNNSLVDDAQILRRILVWLAKSRKNIAGVIYLHEISQTRTPGPALWKNLEFLCNQMYNGERRGCGKGVVLTTTKWDEVPREVGERREKLLKESEWRNMIALGSKVCEFEGTYDSAWNIVDRVLDHVESKKTVEEELQEIERIIARIRGSL